MKSFATVLNRYANAVAWLGVAVVMVLLALALAHMPTEMQP